MAGADERLKLFALRKALIFRKDGHPIVQPVYGGPALSLYLLQLGGYMHHHRLELLLFQL